MNDWLIDAGLAMGVHQNTSNAAGVLGTRRGAVRDSVHACGGAAWVESVPAALAAFWNDQAAVQAQAAESKVRNALAALDAVVANYLTFDFEAAALASRAGDAIPRDVTFVSDKLGPR